MDRIVLKSLAKINLSLDVLGKRENGYHDVEMVMQTVHLSDTVIVEKRDDSLVCVESNLTFLPSDDKNIAVKAAKILMEECGLKTGVNITLQKKIPVAAGLAGGSSNAAAVLFGMNRIFDLGFELKELARIGVRIGADVPYCLLRGTVLARGIGEILTPLPPMPVCTVLLAKPPINVSTKEVYEGLEEVGITGRPDTNGVIEAIRTGDLNALSASMGNVLEPVTERKYPVVGEIRELMLSMGAEAAMMSGSGPTVYGLFEDRAKAKAAQKKITRLGLARQVYVTRIHNRRDIYGSEI